MPTHFAATDRAVVSSQPVTPDSARGHIQNARAGLLWMAELLENFTREQIRDVIKSADVRLSAAIEIIDKQAGRA